MTNIKKIIALICALSMTAVSFGCGAKDEDTSDSDTAAETTAASEEAAENTAYDGSLDADGTLNSMSFKYSSEWIASESEGQSSYTLPDGSGAIIVQVTDGNTFSVETEDEMISMLAEQSEAAWGSLEGMEILSSDWNETAIDGKKCYVIKYNYTISSTDTANTSYFFANYTDTSKDLFTITSTALTADSTVTAATEALLGTITFGTAE